MLYENLDDDELRQAARAMAERHLQDHPPIKPRAQKREDLYFRSAMLRFEAKILRPDNPFMCWEWLGSKVEGYGRFSYKGKNVTAYKFSWAVFRRIVIPRGYVLDHTCVNPGCVNPWHLQLVTYGDNIRLGHKRRRQKQLDIGG